MARINFAIDDALYKRLKHKTIDDDLSSVSAFCRAAIEEKLDRLDRNPRAERIAILYQDLTEQGQAWLEMCAEIASTSDKTRAITQRGVRD